MIWLLTFFIWLAQADSCPQRLRAIIDIGSGSTKLTLAQVEVCPDKIKVIRFFDVNASQSVSLEASKDKNGNISNLALAQLIDAVKALKQKALSESKRLAPQIHEIEIAAAGTHAIRTTNNFNAVAAALDKVGVTLSALSQEQEADVGFAGVQAKGERSCPTPSRLLVWDVGGGSMQWTLAAGDATQPPQIGGLALGSETFKSRLIKQLHRQTAARCEGKGLTPNPLGKSGIAEARRLGTSEAKALPPFLQHLKSEELCVVGIGGVHSYAIEKQIQKSWASIRSCACGKDACTHTANQYSLRELTCLAEHLSRQNDCAQEIRGPYSSTSVSSLFMIEAFMQALGVKELQTSEVNMGHGLAGDRTALKFRKLAD